MRRGVRWPSISTEKTHFGREAADDFDASCAAVYRLTSTALRTRAHKVVRRVRVGAFGNKGAHNAMDLVRRGCEAH